MPFHDSGKTRKPEPYNSGIDDKFLNRICIHCRQRYGIHRGSDSECPVNGWY